MWPPFPYPWSERHCFQTKSGQATRLPDYQTTISFFDPERHCRNPLTEKNIPEALWLRKVLQDSWTRRSNPEIHRLKKTMQKSLDSEHECRNPWTQNDNPEIPRPIKTIQESLDSERSSKNPLTPNDIAEIPWLRKTIQKPVDSER